MGTVALLSFCTKMTIYLECWQVLRSVLASFQTRRFAGSLEQADSLAVRG
jgi:hypothetical protein